MPLLAEYLSDLVDANIASPANFNVLQYDAATSKWVNSNSLTLSQHSADTAGLPLTLRKSRGTAAVPLTIVTGDSLGQIGFEGYDGANYLKMASIEAFATGTVEATRIPTYLTVSVSGSLAPTVRTEVARFAYGVTTLQRYAGTKVLILSRLNGSPGAESAIASLENLAEIQIRGYDGTTASPGVRLRMAATENWSSTNLGSNLQMWVVPTGSAALALRTIWDGTGMCVVGSGVSATVPLVSMFDVTSATGGIITLRRFDTTITAGDMIGKIQFYAADTSTVTNPIAADIEAQAISTISSDINPGRLIFRVTPATVGAIPAEQFRLEAGAFTLSDAVNFAFNTGTGTKFGTATDQKLGFWNAPPVAQQVLATGAGAVVDNVISLLQTLGLCRQS